MNWNSSISKGDGNVGNFFVMQDILQENGLLDTPTAIEILLVDDRPENLLALEATLSSPKYSLVKASSGDEALRYLLDHAPALILMDVQMPNLDGFETASIIKKSERTRIIPIIFITALNKDERFVHQGYDYGAVDYISKPFDAHILKSKVAVFAELARKTQKLLLAEKMLHLNESRNRDRQIAELELRSLRREQIDQRRFLDLVEGIDHGIVWSANLESLAVTYVSNSVQTILGIDPNNHKTNPNFLFECLFPKDPAPLRKAIRELKKGNKEVRLEHHIPTSAKSGVWMQSSLRVSERSDQSEIRGLSIEITQMKDAEEKLRLNAKRAELLARASLLLSESDDYKFDIERITDSVVPEFADGIFVETSAVDESTQVVAIKYTHPERKAVWEAQIELRREVSRSGKRLIEDSFIIFPLIVQGRCFGVVTFLGGEKLLPPDSIRMLEDLTYRIALAMDSNRLFLDLQAAVNVRDEFLSIASHELRTPLTPLKMQIQSLMRILKRESHLNLTPEKLNQLLLSTDKQLSRLTKLVEDLLDISRISAGKVILNLEKFDLVELVAEILERFQGQILESGCEITLKGPASLEVTLDRLRLEQVLINLLTNALKYGSGKPVLITISENKDTVQLSFRDKGIGISKEDQLRIFERFERVNSQNYISGLGLGLFIVKQILSSHSGTIEVESDVGAGSCFTVRLPMTTLESKKTLEITPGLKTGLSLETLVPPATVCTPTVCPATDKSRSP